MPNKLKKVAFIQLKSKWGFSKKRGTLFTKLTL